MVGKRAETVRRARDLRRTMTLPEVLLWRALRPRPDGFRFRRQHPLGAYVLDFYLPKVRLAIEVDGAAHDMGDRPARDLARDAWLARQGVAILRICATDVLHDVEPVIQLILVEAKARLPLHHPPAADGPPPQMGFGED